jgi:hypothetical protein
MSLPPLATPDDIAARLGRTLTDVEATRVVPLLQDASAQVRRYCRRDFLLHAGDTQILRGYDSEILLPDKTTTAVNSVVMIGGGMGLPDLPITWYTFDGIDRIRYDPGRWLINMPEVYWDMDDVYPQTFRIQRDYGYPEVPDDVLSVVATAVIGVLTAPTQAAGLLGETIGPYSYRLERSGGGSGVALAQADLASLADYRTTVGTIRTRLR